MITTVTIQSSDFMPLPDSHKFVFVLYCESKDGKLYNIEEFGTKEDLSSKYNFYAVLDEWDTTQFEGKRCEISLRIFRRPKFVRFLVKNNAAGNFSNAGGNQLAKQTSVGKDD